MRQNDGLNLFLLLQETHVYTSADTLATQVCLCCSVSEDGSVSVSLVKSVETSTHKPVCVCMSNSTNILGHVEEQK